MKILQLMSCRGWSSDAYWAARVSRELQLRGHDVTLGCRAGTDERVIRRARADGVDRIVTFSFASGLSPAADAGDVRRLLGWLPGIDIVHVHRGKEHWLAAIANRLSATPRPIVRTRHIALAVRPHRANRWLYRRGTALVVSVTEAIRRQYIVSGLLDADRIVALPGGADAEAYAPAAADTERRRGLGGGPGVPLVGMVGGLRVMKGHHVVVEAARRLAARGISPHFTLVGRGGMEASIRDAIQCAGLTSQFTLAGFAEKLPAVMACFDVALYVPLESEGMSRVLFEYMAAGRPIVASRVGVVPEVLAHDEHALLVPAGDAAAIADAVARLLADRALAGRLAAEARRLVLDRHSGARVAARLEEHYVRLARGQAA